jgi:IclR family transcriptional regulator, KDG regulon repressor
MNRNGKSVDIRKQFRSLSRAIDILNLLEKKTILPVAEISSLLNMPKSSAYKYLVALRECRLVDYERGSEGYRLGMRLFELGAAVQQGLDLDRIARPYMEGLCAQIDETVGLTILDGHFNVYLDRVEAKNRDGIVLLLRKGIRRPLHAGAAGKILLAYQSEEAIERFLQEETLVPYTDKTVTDPQKLRRQLQIIKKQGYAFSLEEINIGVMAFAAPIFNHEGQSIAGLVVSAPIQRVNDRKKEDILRAVVLYAGKISQRLKAGIEC